MTSRETEAIGGTKGKRHTASEAVKTSFGRNSEFFSQTKWVFAQKYELHSSYLLENVINTCKASFF
jgi:hypothetical protein